MEMSYSYQYMKIFTTLMFNVVFYMILSMSFFKLLTIEGKALQLSPVSKETLNYVLFNANLNWCKNFVLEINN